VTGHEGGERDRNNTKQKKATINGGLFQFVYSVHNRSAAPGILKMYYPLPYKRPLISMFVNAFRYEHI